MKSGLWHGTNALEVRRTGVDRDLNMGPKMMFLEYLSPGALPPPPYTRPEFYFIYLACIQLNLSLLFNSSSNSSTGSNTITMSSPLDEQAMNQLQSQQSELLDKIDELRTIGVGGLVELPQIIVCGNQSSGKSSVLEAISRVRFPARGNICTRFATEVVLRRSPQEKIKVSIDPGDSRKDKQERQKL